MSRFPTSSPVQPVSGTLVARRLLEEVKLMVVFRIKPFSSLNDLGGDLRAVRVEVFLLYLLSHPLSDVFLSRRVVEDGRAILCSAVVSLSVESRRIMCTVEEFNEFSIRHDIWVKLDPQSLGVVRGASTNLSIVRIVGVPSGISNGGLEDPLVLRRRIVLLEDVFDSPEATPCKGSDFRCDFSWGRHGVKSAIEGF